MFVLVSIVVLHLLIWQCACRTMEEYYVTPATDVPSPCPGSALAADQSGASSMLDCAFQCLSAQEACTAFSFQSVARVCQRFNFYGFTYHTTAHCRHMVKRQVGEDCETGDVSYSGKKTLHPPGAGQPVEAYCKQGWTTIQRRLDGSVDFNRTWDEYKNGFGSADGEYWLGNEVIHRMTTGANYSLRVEMQGIYGMWFTADYRYFWIDDESEYYRLHVHDFLSGSPPGDSFHAADNRWYQDGYNFSTWDRDYDGRDSHDTPPNCALHYGNGFWFNSCYYVNLNGPYDLGPAHCSEWNCMHWSDLDPLVATGQLKTVYMMLRKNV